MLGRRSRESQSMTGMFGLYQPFLTIANTYLGTNNIPLGRRQRSSSPNNRTANRSRSPPSSRFDNITPQQQASSDNARIERLRRKKYRWGVPADQNPFTKAQHPIRLETPMTPEQLDAYALNFRIEEITFKIRENDVVPTEAERSPSPTPQYNTQGKRINTPDVRYHKSLETERHKLIQKALKTIPNYKAPSDYRRPLKMQEKIYIPVNDYPEINFIGLLIGPRGNTLKRMESESGAKLAIRGRGSVKEGKGRNDVPNQSSADEPLHCLIIADDESKILKAIEMVNQVIETAASTPEEQNALKRGQLRELAALNGTLRDDESQFCQNCGEPGHRKYDCPNRKNFTSTVTCHICGGVGHYARDCKERPSAGYGNSYKTNNFNSGMSSAADKEYEQLMLELGTGSGQPPGQQPERLRLTDSSRDGGQDSFNQSRGGPAPWQQRPQNNGNDFNNQQSGSHPWQKRPNNDNYNGYDNGRSRNYHGNNNGNNYNRGNNDRGNYQEYDRDRRQSGRRPPQGDDFNNRQQYGGGNNWPQQPPQQQQQRFQQAPPQQNAPSFPPAFNQPDPSAFFPPGVRNPPNFPQPPPGISGAPAPGAVRIPGASPGMAPGAPKGPPPPPPPPGARSVTGPPGSKPPPPPPPGSQKV